MMPGDFLPVFLESRYWATPLMADGPQAGRHPLLNSKYDGILVIQSQPLIRPVMAAHFEFGIEICSFPG